MDPIFAKDLVDRLARMEDKQDITAVALVRLQDTVGGLSERLTPVERHISEVQFWTRALTKGRIALIAIATLGFTIWDKFGNQIRSLLDG